MASSSVIMLNIADLHQLNKALNEGKNMRVNVGVLADKAQRQDADWNTEKINNPTLGLIHEFGSKSNNIPVRSFLRMPLMTVLPKKADLIGRGVWKSIILKKGLPQALKDLGELGVGTVKEAFASGGYGQWAPNKPATIRRKGSNRPLIDSTQLSKSITSKVVGGGNAK